MNYLHLSVCPGCPRQLRPSPTSRGRQGPLTGLWGWAVLQLSLLLSSRFRAGKRESLGDPVRAEFHLSPKRHVHSFCPWSCPSSLGPAWLGWAGFTPVSLLGLLGLEVVDSLHQYLCSAHGSRWARHSGWSWRTKQTLVLPLDRGQLSKTAQLGLTEVLTRTRTVQSSGPPDRASLLAEGLVVLTSNESGLYVMSEEIRVCQEEGRPRGR